MLTICLCSLVFYSELIFGLSAPGFHIFPCTFISTFMPRPNQVEMSLAEVPPWWEYPVLRATEAACTVLCICCSGYLIRVFTGLEALFTWIPQFGFPSPQRLRFFSHAWHRPKALILHRVLLPPPHHPTSSAESAPCWSSGPAGTFFCPSLHGEAALRALAFVRGLTSNSCRPKATAAAHWPEAAHLALGAWTCWCPWAPLSLWLSPLLASSTWRSPSLVVPYSFFQFNPVLHGFVME